MAKLNPQRLVFGLFLLVLIVVGEVVLHHFEWPTWPAFMIMIFFFVEHMNTKKIPEILVGGCVGIACIILAKYMIGALAPIMGQQIATLVFIVVVVYAIVAFGEILPIVFNNYAFMFLTVSAAMANAGKAPPDPFVWMAVELVAGGIFIAGIIGILKIMGALAARKAAPPAAEG
jgi:hypothetical protein